MVKLSLGSPVELPGQNRERGAQTLQDGSGLRREKVGSRLPNSNRCTGLAEYIYMGVARKADARREKEKRGKETEFYLEQKCTA